MDLHLEIEELLKKLKKFLKDKDFKEAEEDIDHNEGGIAFELMCDVLTEEETVIPLEIYEKINEIGTAMGVDHRDWEDIKTDRPRGNSLKEK